MRCPFCGFTEDRVLDSRESPDGTSIRRRRECKSCGRRYTTFEQIELQDLFVIKRNGDREPFDRSKLLKGMQIACTGRPVSVEDLDSAAAEIERMLRNRLEREVASQVIGDMVMDKLKVMDQVAYVRFASVYRQFEDATQFRELLRNLKKR